MTPEQREVLDEIVLKMRAGRLTRRTFLERALHIGLTAGAATALLEACATICTPGCKPNVIVWQGEYDAQGIFGNLVTTFNTKHPDSHVTYYSGDPSSDRQYTKLSQMLRTCTDASQSDASQSIDVISIDVAWLPEFASKCWIIPVGPTIESAVGRKYQAMPWAIEGCTYKSKLYTAPLRVDVGVLYYRHDVTPDPPKTWQDLVKKVNEVRRGGKDIADGFVWQGSQQEGLMCDFVEVLAGYEGTIPDSQGLPTVTIKESGAVEALITMMNWLTISPKDILTYDEESAVIRFENDFAVFMRNWYNALSQVIDSKAKVHNAAYFTSIPHGEASTQQIGYSCVGGWQLGINAASRNQDLARQFIQYVLEDKSIESYVTSDILSAHPADAWRSDTSIKEIVKHLVFRPRSPKYMQTSKTMQSIIFKALCASSQDSTKQRAIAVEAIDQLKSQWRNILPT